MDIEDNTNTEVDQEIIKQATELGWTPQDKFKGDPDKWVDADEFVRRGEHLMPILRKTNTRLKSELAQRDSEIDKLRSDLDNVRGTLDRLDQHYSAANKRAAEQAIGSLKEALKSAREDNDVDKEVELLSQIGLAQDEVKRLAQEDEDKGKEKKEVSNKQVTGIDPSLVAWQRENSWFGTDPKKTKQFNRIAEDLREEINESGEDLTGREFLDRCNDLWEKSHGDSLPNKTDSGGRSSSGSSGSGPKGWNQLPKEAKDVCLADADYLVGEGKRFKTLDEWKKEYTRIYNAT